MPVKVTEFRLKLYPKDFTLVREFYEKKLGFPVTGEWDRGEDDKGVMFQVGPAVLELLSPEVEHKPLQGSDVSWEVPNVHALWDELKGSDSIVFALRDNAWGDTSFCIADPEGFKISFFARKHEA